MSSTYIASASITSTTSKFIALGGNAMNPEPLELPDRFDDGYEEGEADTTEVWAATLRQIKGWPSDVNPESPVQVARYIERLMNPLVKVEPNDQTLLRPLPAGDQTQLDREDELQQ